MASFYAELQVAGTNYPVRFCAYEFSQATNERGRVTAKVRHGLVHLTLDVPDDEVLLDWANTAHKPLAGRVIFRNAQGGAALETLSWETGECVGYQEEFLSGSVSAGAYVCHLTIAAPQLTMAPGGPAGYLSPPAGEHGTPQQGLVNPMLGPLLTRAAPVVAPVVETVVGGAVAAVLAPVALILALILGSSTPAQAPGIVPMNRDEARLRYLVAQHAAGNLAPGEEAELIALLAKVKGIHIQRLEDLADPNALKLPMRGGNVPLRNFTYLHNFAYTKRAPADKAVLRKKFDSSGRAAFLKHLTNDQAKMDRMKRLGLTDVDLARIKEGKCPKGYQVHHKLSLDDGGDNHFDNLVLIKDEPYHRAVTVFQNSSTSALQPGQTQVLDWPTVDDYIYPNF